MKRGEEVNKAREKKKEKVVNEGAEVPYPMVPSKKETGNNHALWRSFTANATLLQVFKGYVNKET